MPSPVGPRMNPFPSTKPPADDRPSAKGSTPGVGGSAPSIKPPASKPIGIDRDGDGKIDIFVTPKPGIGIDTDGDGIIDISFPKEPPTSQPPAPQSPAPQPPAPQPPDGKSPDVKRSSPPFYIGPDNRIILLPRYNL